MRKLSELYQLLLDKPDYYSYDDRLFRSGICLKLYGFLKVGLLTKNEFDLIDKDVIKHLPKPKPDRYCWVAGKNTGRIRFIKKRIQDLTNQNK